MMIIIVLSIVSMRTNRTFHSLLLFLYPAFRQVRYHRLLLAAKRHNKYGNVPCSFVPSSLGGGGLPPPPSPSAPPPLPVLPPPMPPNHPPVQHQPWRLPFPYLPPQSVDIPAPCASWDHSFPQAATGGGHRTSKCCSSILLLAFMLFFCCFMPSSAWRGAPREIFCARGNIQRKHPASLPQQSSMMCKQSKQRVQ